VDISFDDIKLRYEDIWGEHELSTKQLASRLSKVLIPRQMRDGPGAPAQAYVRALKHIVCSERGKRRMEG
jgi:hypothetical protein